MPLVSVVIPVYNVEEYIAQCVQSVMKQTLKDIEIICIDDCGSDNSFKIVENFAKSDTRIKIFRNAANYGQSIVRSVGINNAKGKYIFFLDSDDYLLENALEDMYKKAQEFDNDVVLSKTEILLDGISNPIIEKRIKFAQKRLALEPFDNIQVTKENFDCMVQNIPVVVWNRLFKLQFLKDNKIDFIHENVTYEDIGFFIKYLACFPSMSAVDSYGLVYRIRPNSTTTSRRGIVKKDLKKYIKDITLFLNNRFRKEEAKEMLKLVASTPVQANHFEKNFLNLLRITWTKYQKRVIFLGIPLFGQKTDKEDVIYKILGFIKIKKKYQGQTLEEKFNEICYKGKL